MQKISCEMWLLIEFASGRNWWWNYVCWKSCQNHKWINFRLNWRLAIEIGRLSTVRQYVIFGQNQHFSGAKERESPVSFWLGWSMTKPTKMGFITIDNPENNVAKFGWAGHTLICSAHPIPIQFISLPKKSFNCIRISVCCNVSGALAKVPIKTYND